MKRSPDYKKTPPASQKEHTKISSHNKFHNPITPSVFSPQQSYPPAPPHPVTASSPNMLEAKVSPPVPHAHHPIASTTSLEQPNILPVIGRGCNPTQHYLNTISATPSDGAMCIAATSALRCISEKMPDILSILQHGGYEGTYIIDVGFNEGMLNRGGSILEQIHIFLENKVRRRVAQDVAAKLFPFPVFFDTPSGGHQFRTPSSNSKMWDLWTLHGIYHPWIKPQNLNSVSPMDGSEASETRGGGTIPQQANGEGTGGNGTGGNGTREKGKQPRQDSDDDTGDNRGGDDGGDNRASQPDTSGQIMYRDRRPQKINIPFSSTLNCHRGSTELDLSFRTNACLTIKLSSGYHDPHPDIVDLVGPWMEAKFTSLNCKVTAQDSEDKAGYSLGLSRIRIASASMPRSAVFSYSPTNSEQDTIKVKSESSRSAGLCATFGLTPSAQLEGTLGRTLGEERNQNKWKVAVHSLTLDDKNGTSENNQTTVIWKYIHNDGFHPRTALSSPEPKPSAIFGLDSQTRLPVIETNVLMQYFRSNGSRGFRDWFTQSTLPEELPVYRNFIHQATITIDLGLVEEDVNVWIRDLTSDDVQNLCGPGEKRSQFPPLVKKLGDYAGPCVSTADISLTRVFIGRVAPRISPFRRMFNKIKSLCSVCPSETAQEPNNFPYT